MRNTDDPKHVRIALRVQQDLMDLVLSEAKSRRVAYAQIIRDILADHYRKQPNVKS